MSTKTAFVTLIKALLTPEPADNHRKNYMEKYWLMTYCSK